MIRNPMILPELPTIASGQFGLTETTFAVPSGALSGWQSLGTLTEAVDELSLDLVYNSSSRAVAISLQSDGATIVDRLIVHSVGSGACVPVRLPIHIPAGPLSIAAAANVSGSVSVAPTAGRFSVPRTASSIVPLTAINLATLLNTGQSLPMSASAGAWTNIGAPLAAAAKAIIISANTGGDFDRAPTGPAVLQLSLDGTTVLGSTVAWQSPSGFSIACRLFEHEIPAGSQIRARAWPTSLTPPDNISLSVSLVR